MTADNEIAAMSKIAAALTELDRDAVVRVLRWANDRYSTTIGLPSVRSIPTVTEQAAAMQELPDLFHTTEPKDGPQKALVTAYWLQVSKGEQEWTAQAVNGHLKNLGHGIGNITDALTSLMSQSPSLVIQTRKQGGTRQARKLYKVTQAGIRKVQQMLTRSDE